MRLGLTGVRCCSNQSERKENWRSAIIAQKISYIDPSSQQKDGLCCMQSFLILLIKCKTRQDALKNKIIFLKKKNGTRQKIIIFHDKIIQSSVSRPFRNLT